MADGAAQEDWYNDALFYVAVAMLTFTSIVGTLLYYKEQLLPQKNKEDEDEKIHNTPSADLTQCTNPKDEETDTSRENDRDTSSVTNTLEVTEERVEDRQILFDVANEHANTFSTEDRSITPTLINEDVEDIIIEQQTVDCCNQLRTLPYEFPITSSLDSSPELVRHHNLTIVIEADESVIDEGLEEVEMNRTDRYALIFNKPLVSYDEKTLQLIKTAELKTYPQNASEFKKYEKPTNNVPPQNENISKESKSRQNCMNEAPNLIGSSNSTNSSPPIAVVEDAIRAQSKQNHLTGSYNKADENPPIAVVEESIEYIHVFTTECSTDEFVRKTPSLDSITHFIVNSDKDNISNRTSCIDKGKQENYSKDQPLVVNDCKKNYQENHENNSDTTTITSHKDITNSATIPQVSGTTKTTTQNCEITRQNFSDSSTEEIAPDTLIGFNNKSRDIETDNASLNTEKLNENSNVKYSSFNGHPADQEEITDDSPIHSCIKDYNVQHELIISNDKYNNKNNSYNSLVSNSIQLYHNDHKENASQTHYNIPTACENSDKALHSEQAQPVRSCFKVMKILPYTEQSNVTTGVSNANCSLLKKDTNPLIICSTDEKQQKLLNDNELICDVKEATTTNDGETTTRDVINPITSDRSCNEEDTLSVFTTNINEVKDHHKSNTNLHVYEKYCMSDNTNELIISTTETTIKTTTAAERNIDNIQLLEITQPTATPATIATTDEKNIDSNNDTQLLETTQPTTITTTTTTTTADEDMGKVLGKIFDTDKFEELPLERVQQLGGHVIISEDGEYAIIDIEGKRKEYRINRRKMKNSTKTLNKKFRDSKDLTELFDELESLDVVDQSSDRSHSLLQQNTNFVCDNQNTKVNLYDLSKLAETMQKNNTKEVNIEDNLLTEESHILSENNNVILNDKNNERNELIPKFIDTDKVLNSDSWEKQANIEGEHSKNTTQTDVKSLTNTFNETERDLEVQEVDVSKPAEISDKCSTHSTEVQDVSPEVHLISCSNNIPQELVIQTHGVKINCKVKEQTTEGEIPDQVLDNILKINEGSENIIAVDNELDDHGFNECLDNPNNVENVTNVYTPNHIDDIINEKNISNHFNISNHHKTNYKRNQRNDLQQDDDSFQRNFWGEPQSTNKSCGNSPLNEQFIDPSHRNLRINSCLNPRQRSKSLDHLHLHRNVHQCSESSTSDNLNLNRSKSMEILNQNNKNSIRSRPYSYHHGSKIRETNLDELMQSLQSSKIQPSQEPTTAQSPRVVTANIPKISDENNNHNKNGDAQTATDNNQNNLLTNELSVSDEIALCMAGSETEIDPTSSSSENDSCFESDYKNEAIPKQQQSKKHPPQNISSKPALPSADVSQLRIHRFSDSFNDCLLSDAIEILWRKKKVKKVLPDDRLKSIKHSDGYLGEQISVGDEDLVFTVNKQFFHASQDVLFRAIPGDETSRNITSKPADGFSKDMTDGARDTTDDDKDTVDSTRDMNSIDNEKHKLTDATTIHSTCDKFSINTEEIIPCNASMEFSLQSQPSDVLNIHFTNEPTSLRHDETSKTQHDDDDEEDTLNITYDETNTHPEQQQEDDQNVQNAQEHIANENDPESCAADGSVFSPSSDYVHNIQKPSGENCDNEEDIYPHIERNEHEEQNMSTGENLMDENVDEYEESFCSTISTKMVTSATTTTDEESDDDEEENTTEGEQCLKRLNESMEIFTKDSSCVRDDTTDNEPPNVDSCPATIYNEESNMQPGLESQLNSAEIDQESSDDSKDDNSLHNALEVLNETTDGDLKDAFLTSNKPQSNNPETYDPQSNDHQNNDLQTNDPQTNGETLTSISEIASSSDDDEISDMSETSQLDLTCVTSIDTDDYELPVPCIELPSQTTITSSNSSSSEIFDTTYQTFATPDTTMDITNVTDLDLNTTTEVSSLLDESIPDIKNINDNELLLNQEDNELLHLLTSTPRIEETEQDECKINEFCEEPMIDRLDESTSEIMPNLSDILQEPIKPSIEISLETDPDTSFQDHLCDTEIQDTSNSNKENIPKNEIVSMTSDLAFEEDNLKTTNPSSSLTIQSDATNDTSSDSLYSYVEGECLDSTRDLKHAVLTELLSPRKTNDETKSTRRYSNPNLPVLLRLKEWDGMKPRANSIPSTLLNNKKESKKPLKKSWLFSSDYKLSSSSKSLIQSIEQDMQAETLNDLDPEPEEQASVHELLSVKASLKRVASDNVDNDAVDTDKHENIVLSESRDENATLLEVNIKSNNETEEMPSFPKQSNLDQKQAVPDDKCSVPDKIPPVPDKNQLVPDKKRSVSDEKQSAPDEKPSVMEGTPPEEETTTGSSILDEFLKNTSIYDNKDNVADIKSKEAKLIKGEVSKSQEIPMIHEENLASPPTDQIKDSSSKRLPSETCLQSPTSNGSSTSIPRNLKSKDKSTMPLSQSLHSIFSGEDLETDIDDVDDNKLQDVLTSSDLKEKSTKLLVTDVDNFFTPIFPPSTTTIPPPTTATKRKQRKFIIVSKIDRRVSFRHKSNNDDLPGVVKRCSSWGQKLSRPMSVNLHNKEIRQQTRKDVQQSNIFQPFASEIPLETDTNSLAHQDKQLVSPIIEDVPPPSEQLHIKNAPICLFTEKLSQTAIDVPEDADDKLEKDIPSIYIDSEISIATDQGLDKAKWFVISQNNKDKTLDLNYRDEAIPFTNISAEKESLSKSTPLPPSMSDNVDVNVARWVSSTLPEKEIKEATPADLHNTSSGMPLQPDVPDNSSNSTVTSSNATSNSNAIDAVVCTSLNLYHINKSEEQFSDKQIIVKIPDEIARQINNKTPADIREDITDVTEDFIDNNNNNSMADKNAIISANNEKNKRHSRKVRDSWDFLERPKSITTPKGTRKDIEKGVIIRNNSKESPSVKHKSWNILDLKTDTNSFHLESFINSLADVPEKKRDSLDIDLLFHQYQKEREALQKLRQMPADDSKRRDSISDFSEISSISDEGNSTRGSWYQDISEIDEPELSHHKATSVEHSPRSAFASVKTKGTKVQPSSEASLRMKSKSDKGNNLVSPLNVQPLENDSNESKPEIAEIKPLPSPSKPDFVPEMACFNEEDLGNMVMAQAVSAVRKRRGGRARRAVMNNEEPPAPIKGLNTSLNTESTTPINELINAELAQTIKPEPLGATTMESATERTNPLKESETSSTQISEPTDKTTKDAASSLKIPRAILDMKPSESPKLKRSKQTWSIDKDDGIEKPTKPKNTEQAEVKLKKRPGRAATFSAKSTTKPVVHERHQSLGAEKASKTEHKRQSDIILRNSTLHEKNVRSYDYVNSMPNLHIKSRQMHSSSEIPINYESEDYFSETSFASDTGLESCLEGSIADDQVFLYPSMHNPNKHNKNKPLGEDFSDSSGDESFTTEQSHRFHRLTSRDTERTVSCGNPPCSRRQHIVGQHKSQFLSCNSCFTCYCSKTCKRMHWKEHRRTCFFGRVSVYIKALIRKCERDTKLNADLRHLSLHSHQLKGRGCLLLAFQSPSEAKAAAISEDNGLLTTPFYSTIDSIVKKDKRTKHSRILHQNIIDYDPEQEFVINISIKIGKTSTSNAKKRISNVVRCARISMQSRADASATTPGKSLSSYYIRTFCLPKVSTVEYMNDTEVRRYYCKELSFSLKRCGVRLKVDYPEAYEKLCCYVEDEKQFLPIVLYGQRSGKNFKCILHQGKYNPTEEARGEGVLV